MNERSGRLLCIAVLCLCMLSMGSCAGKDKDPVKPRINHPPRIDSVEVIPGPVALFDSVTIICHAVDPDGDSLVYDWFSQTPLWIAGAPQKVYLYGTTSNERAVYYAGPASSASSVPMQVFARESVSGLQDGVAFRVQLKN